MKDGEKIEFGDGIALDVVETPGHTGGCVSYVLDDKSCVFTGDTLLIRGCGRTDFQSGSSETLFSSVRDKLFGRLPEECLVFPAHDYNGRTCSSIGEEKAHNPRLKLTNGVEDFKKIMSELQLAYPKKIDVALPANAKCGLDIEDILEKAGK